MKYLFSDGIHFTTPQQKLFATLRNGATPHIASVSILGGGFLEVNLAHEFRLSLGEFIRSL